MSKFAVIVHGVNFLIRDSETSESELRGFYVNAFVKAPTSEVAEYQVINLVRTSVKLRSLATNPPGNPPRMFVDETVELTDWPDAFSRPLSGFAFYDDPDAEWLNESKDT